MATSRPVPDPTTLTTDIVNGAKADLRRELETEIRHLKELYAEKFKDNKLALDAALQAAEKAVGKSEAAFTKQIDEMGRTNNAVTAGMMKEIDDLKSRVGAAEGRSTGMGMSASALVTIVMAAAAIVGPILTIVAMRHT